MRGYGIPIIHVYYLPKLNIVALFAVSQAYFAPH